MVCDIDDPIVGHVLHPGAVPVVPEDPGQIRWTGPAIGAHTEEVLRELLDMSQDGAI
jgi:formyl-CoA transferase